MQIQAGQGVEDETRRIAERALERIGVLATERSTEVARGTADEALERVGLPSSAEIADAVGDIAQMVRLPDRYRPRLPCPRGVGHGLRYGAGWVQDQLEPLLDPFHHHGARRRPGAQPTADDRGWGVLEWVAFTWLLDWPSEREPSLSIDNDRALWTFEAEDDGRFEQWHKTIFVPPAGYAARVGDVMLHGDAIAPGLGSPNVWIGGRPALRVCDSHVCTKTTPGPHAGSGFVVTYPRVEINGFAALRVGDYVDEGVHGKNPIAVGCPTVVIGPRPPQVECWAPGVDVGGRRPEVFGYRFRKAQLGYIKGKVVLGADVGRPLLRVEGTVTAAKLWAEQSMAVDPPPGDVDANGKAEALPMTSRGKSERALGVGTVGREAHAAARRVDQTQPTPEASEVKPPKLETMQEIVELP